MTQRVIPAALASALDADTAIPHLLAELQFDSATVRLTDIPYSVTWGGVEWSGLGQMVGIESIREGGQLQAQDLIATLSGIPLALVALVLSETVTDRPVTIYLAGLDRTSHVIVDAMALWGGRMDVMTLDEDGQTATARVKLENEMVGWQRPAQGRYTHADQQQRFPGDTGYRFVAQMAQKDIVWPQKSFFRQ